MTLIFISGLVVFNFGSVFDLPPGGRKGGKRRREEEEGRGGGKRRREEEKRRLGLLSHLFLFLLCPIMLHVHSFLFIPLYPFHFKTP